MAEAATGNVADYICISSQIYSSLLKCRFVKYWLTCEQCDLCPYVKREHWLVMEFSNCSIVLECPLIPANRNITKASGNHCCKHWATLAIKVVFPQPSGPYIINGNVVVPDT